MSCESGLRRLLTERVLRRLSRRARSLARSEQGVALKMRVGGSVAIACVVSNFVGAAVVFVVAGPVRPPPRRPASRVSAGTVLGRARWLPAGAFGIGAVWSVRLLLPVLTWLLPECGPDEAQQR
ncbi:MAG TPA: hypothetical protein VLR26_16075 [Frankiaceae bacterium]|nr:hypothetical protein [Frankiaceae bacterium]